MRMLIADTRARNDFNDSDCRYAGPCCEAAKNFAAKEATLAV